MAAGAQASDDLGQKGSSSQNLAVPLRSQTQIGTVVQELLRYDRVQNKFGHELTIMPRDKVADES